MKRFVLMLFCALQLVSASPKINITRCCTSGYQILKSQCDQEDDSINPSPPWEIPIQSLQNNQSKSYDFQFEYNFIQCPDGYVVKHASQFDFQLYNDGSLVTQSGNFSSKEFCLAEMVAQNRTFVARFCVPDPCGKKNCMRKCCPLGMVVDMETRDCQLHPKEFEVNIRNEDGSIAKGADVYVIDGATFPSCEDGTYPLENDVGNENVFFILPSGKLKILDYPDDDSITNEYCIDHFQLDGNITSTAMICFPEQEKDPNNISIYRWFLLVSSVFLIMTFIVYAVLPEIQNIHGVTIMCHVASLAVMYITFAMIQLQFGVAIDANHLCIALAVIAHFTWLASFTWLNVMSFDIWLTFSDLKPRSSRQNGRRHRLGSRFVFYSIYAWGVPTLIVVIGQILDNSPNVPNNILKPEFGVTRCWFKDDNSTIAYLYGPIGAIILSNIVFFVLTATKLYQASIETAFATNNNRNKQKFRVIFSLFILMGVSWMMEIISFAAGDFTAEWIWIPTDIINISTGIFIFIIFVCKKSVWNLLKKKWGMLNRLEKAIARSGRFNVTQEPQRNDTSTSAVSKSHHLDSSNKTEKTRISMYDSVQTDSQ